MFLSYTIHVKFYINLKLCDMFFFNPQDLLDKFLLNKKKKKIN